MKAVILAAGLGTRLGNGIPKPLTMLTDDKSILGFQIDKLQSIIGLHNIIVVVGYEFQSIMKEFPQLTYVYNHQYATHNCAKSLLLGLQKIHNEDVIFLDGDVYFDDGVLSLLLNDNCSAALVKIRDCEDEEPYTGTCKLELPIIAAKPTDCPVFGDGTKCNWVEVIP